MTIRVYVSKHCGPCKQVEKMIKQGQVNEDIELIDIETDSGFEKFKAEVLEHGDGAVPSAYKDGKQCRIGFSEDETLVFECPTDDLPSSGQD